MLLIYSAIIVDDGIASAGYFHESSKRFVKHTAGG